MLFCRGNLMGLIVLVLLGDFSIKWVIKVYVLGLIVDYKLIWDVYVMDVKKCFVIKLDLLKCFKFLLKSVL